VLVWLSVWSEVQTCICHCHSLSLASVKSRSVWPFWYRLTRVVPDKGPLNGCVCIARGSSDELDAECWRWCECCFACVLLLSSSLQQPRNLITMSSKLTSRAARIMVLICDRSPHSARNVRAHDCANICVIMSLVNLRNAEMWHEIGVLLSTSSGPVFDTSCAV